MTADRDRLRTRVRYLIDREQAVKVQRMLRTDTKSRSERQQQKKRIFSTFDHEMFEFQDSLKISTTFYSSGQSQDRQQDRELDPDAARSKQSTV